MPSAAQPRHRSAGRSFLLPVALAVAALAAYVRALPYPFVYDDLRTVVTNASLTDVSNWRAILWHDVTRPLVNLTYAIDHAAWGLDPRGFRAGNVALHAVAVVLLFALTSKVVGDAARMRPVVIAPRVAAGTAALLFAVHPVMTQAVGYISGRDEVLCAVTFLAGLLLLRRYVLGGSAAWLTAGLLAWLAALASKEVGAMLPFVLYGWDRLVLPRDEASRRRSWRLHAPLIGLTLAAGLARLAVLWCIENPGEGRVFWTHLLVELDVVRRYVQLIVVPSGQSAFHAVAPIGSILDVRALGAILLVGGLGAVAWRLRRREPIVTFGLAWFGLLVLPSTVPVFVDLGEPMAEQRIYLASCGLFVAAGTAAAWLHATLSSSRARLVPAFYVAVGIVAAALVAATEVRLSAWATPVALWEDAERKAPGTWVPPLMLGDALDAVGRTPQAVAAYRRAVANGPDQPIARLKLGTMLMQTGDVEGATRAFNEVLALDPRSVTAMNALGAVAMIERRPAEARGYYEAALRAAPNDIPARQLLSALAEQEGQPAEALRWCEQIQALAPGTPGNAECIERNRAAAAPPPDAH